MLTTTADVRDCLDWTLPSDLADLRARALDGHRRGFEPTPELTLADAAAWAARPADEPWLVWRGRRVQARLERLPVAVTRGERLAGLPSRHQPTAAEQVELAAAQQALADCPPFPGGDNGHLHPDWAKLLRLGIGGLRAEIDALTAFEGETPFYVACRLSLDGLSTWLRRIADACPDAVQAERCRRLASEPPRTFTDALQLLWATLAALWVAEDHGLTNPSRLDQVLAPFYDADLATGRLTPREAFEQIACLYIQLNRICPASLAVAVVVGGVDESGRDLTHDLTYLCLAARLATRLSYPTVGIAWHDGTPAALTEFGVAMLATGIGCPAFFNDTVIAAGLQREGVTVADSHRWMNSTCVEIKVAGASNIWVATPYFNLAQALLDALATEPASYADLEAEVERVLRGRVSAAARSIDATWWQRAVHGGYPLASCLTDDCLARGLDLDQGGCRYEWVENSFVGLANLADSLVAVRELVYAGSELTLSELRAALAADWAGHEALRQRVLNRLAHYGNDDGSADAVAARWAEWLIDATHACTIGPHRYVPGFFCWIQHEALGRQTGATPDGRHAGAALADGAGPAQGRELRGPTAAVLSTTTWSHTEALGGLVHNLKFSGPTLQTAAGRAVARQVIETYLRRGGLEIQVNVVSRETLLAAQADPEAHRDLVVRVAGYSDYFVNLNAGMQAEVLARTEHTV